MKKRRLKTIMKIISSFVFQMIKARLAEDQNTEDLAYKAKLETQM